MRFVFAAGGTVYHINPALAVAAGLKERYPEAEILFIGTKDHLEAKLVPAAGFAFKTIEISGFQRKLNFNNIKKNCSTVVKLLKSSGAAKKILKDFKPDVAIGFGGYVSDYVLRQAAKLGIKTAIHEQNAFPGVANKALAKYVDRVMITVADAEKLIKAKNGCIVTGLPVRGEVVRAQKAQARSELGLDLGWAAYTFIRRQPRRTEGQRSDDRGYCKAARREGLLFYPCNGSIRLMDERQPARARCVP